MKREAKQEDSTDIILDSIADGVFTVNQDWQITSFNKAAESITGVPKVEAIGRQCCDIFKASICENECALRKTFESGRQIINRQVYIINASGETVPISISTALLKDGGGRIIGGVETFRDLSTCRSFKKATPEKILLSGHYHQKQKTPRDFRHTPDYCRKRQCRFNRGRKRGRQGTVRPRDSQPVAQEGEKTDHHKLRGPARHTVGIGTFRV